jgi:type II pantothenate kinase
MSNYKLGIDFGLTNTDLALVSGSELIRSWTLPYAGPASLEVLQKALSTGDVDVGKLERIATTGGLHRKLPEAFEGVPLYKAGEAQSVGRGGLALAGLDEALVVSAGTGTAMIAARGNEAQHLTGSAVGGGTLLGLSRLLIGTADPLEIARLAARGDPGGVDSTLADAIGGGIGHLPASATAVNFGRVAASNIQPSREDIAAGLVTIVAQVIGVIAINAAKAAGFKNVVIVGHLPDLLPIRAALERVWDFYLVDPKPIVPQHSGAATAFGAALCDP